MNHSILLVARKLRILVIGILQIVMHHIIPLMRTITLTNHFPAGEGTKESFPPKIIRRLCVTASLKFYSSYLRKRKDKLI